MESKTKLGGGFTIGDSRPQDGSSMKVADGMSKGMKMGSGSTKPGYDTKSSGGDGKTLSDGFTKMERNMTTSQKKM